ncbi:MAG: toxin, partial [Polyangiaceae bacterium]|nr:toxin [Polyangiaceae bacterium]
PQLSLGYSSGAGNGLFGLGWSVGLPAISRKTDKGLPEYRDEADSDTFMLAGFEDLVPVLVDAERDVVTVGTEKRERFRPRVEIAGGFARIERVTIVSGEQDVGTVFWRSTTKDNVTSTFGRSAAARIADPAAEGTARRVFSWLLEESRDDRGNVVRYEYKADSELEAVAKATHERHRHAGFAVATHRHPKRILYGNGGDLSTPPAQSDFHFEVVFDYGEHDADAPTPDDEGTWLARQDAFSTYRAGFELRTYRLCRRVLVVHRGFTDLDANGDPVLVRSLDFTYDETPSVAYLTSATQRGYISDGQGGYAVPESLPPVRFDYSRPTFATPRALKELVQESTWQHAGCVPFATNGRGYQWLDLDGEGAPGVLMLLGSSSYYKRNLGEGRLGGATALAVTPAMMRTAGPAGAGPGSGGAAQAGSQFLDVTGSGRPALVTLERPVRGYFPREEGDKFGAFRPFVELPNIDWRDPSLRFIDLDGDGFADVLMSGDHVYTWWRFERGRGYGEPRQAPRFTDERRGPSLVFREPEQTVFLADMTGDGLTDLVRIKNGSVCYWPNLGHGRFGAMVSMGSAPVMAPSNLYQPARVRLADVDGTGTADLVYLGQDGVRVWMNQAGNSFAPAQRLAVVPDADAIGTVDVVDVLGSGTACLVWASASPGRAPHLRYVDLLLGQKPHLLVKVENGLGLETRISYTTSAKLYIQDRAARRPWATKVPFPVQVVDRVEHYDHVSRHRFVQSFRYRHGFYDPEEREFRGFGYVETRDAESIGADLGLGSLPDYPVENGERPLPPVVTKTWYHTGAWQKEKPLFEAYATEWYADSTAPVPLRLSMPPMETGLSAQELREAHRALGGKMLREEVYAEDGSANAGRPYSVRQATYQVTKLQRALYTGRPGSGSRPKHPTPASFLVAPSEALAVQHERQTCSAMPPRVFHEFVLEVDALGYVTKSAIVAYGYARFAGANAPAAAYDEQDAPLISASEVSLFHKLDDTGWYRHGVPLAEKSYELHASFLPSTGLATATDLTSAMAATTVAFDGTLSSSTKRLLAHAKHQYWEDELNDPLALGSVQSRALPYQSYVMALTADMLSTLSLLVDGNVSSIVTTDGGYVLGNTNGLGGSSTECWARSGTSHFSSAAFYQVDSVTDVFGNTTSVAYDSYKLFPTLVTDALDNETAALIDYRVLAPKKVTDPNDNYTEAAFDALGRVTATSVHGANGDGDTLSAPTARFTYETDRYVDDGLPVRVKTELRETHAVANNETRWLTSYAYSNGSGAVVLTKTMVEPGLALVFEYGHVKKLNGEVVYDTATPRYVGSGRLVVDNKGNPVKQYEPYFSPTLEYEDDADLKEWGVSPVLSYDPLGRLIRTDHPDGSYAYTTFDAWTQEFNDGNDTAQQGQDWYDARQQTGTPEPDQDAADKANAHVNTPTKTYFDALGRPFVVDEHERVGSTNSHLVTKTVQDIQGIVRTVVDAKGRDCMLYVPSMLGAALKQTSIDAGTRWSFATAAGEPVRAWGERGFTHRFAYDQLRRPTHRWLNDGGQSDKLVERLAYGEAHADAATNYLRGKLVARYDQSGVLLTESFDFKGNLLAQTRRLATGYENLVDWVALANPAYTPAEVATAATNTGFLDASETFTHEYAFDALNRPTSVTLPDATDIRAAFDIAGFLKSVEAYLRGSTTATGFVDEILYDEHGRRTSITYAVDGTTLTTRYGYDPLSRRLTSFETERGSTSPATYLQKLAYTYDAVGNITRLTDSATQSVYFSAASVESADRDFTYSAVYRLIQAIGREHGSGADVQLDEDERPLHTIIPHPNDPTGFWGYTETYAYDAVGNILTLVHDPDATGIDTWTRAYTYEDTPDCNRLVSTTKDSSNRDYTHDEHGNMVSMPHLETLDWDYADQLRHVDKGNNTGQETWFVYDATGERVRKVYVHNGYRDERIYLGGYEIYRRRNSATLALIDERETVHVADDQRRIAMVESLTTFGGTAVDPVVPRIRFQLDDHLGTACVEVDEEGAVISFEEYHPFGTTSYHSFQSSEVSAKRYRYTGKERDEETGLAYHGARYYCPWLGRWTSADPAGLVDGPNLYGYCRGDPVGGSDPSGLQPVNDSTDIEAKSTLPSEGTAGAGGAPPNPYLGQRGAPPAPTATAPGAQQPPNATAQATSAPPGGGPVPLSTYADDPSLSFLDWDPTKTLSTPSHGSTAPTLPTKEELAADTSLPPLGPRGEITRERQMAFVRILWRDIREEAEKHSVPTDRVPFLIAYA